MGSFKGKHIGYKGFIRKDDNAICLITLYYDHSKKDPLVKNARYTHLCFVKEIEIASTGERLDGVIGYCSYPHFAYWRDKFIFNKEIYFFPANVRNAKEKAINYAKISLMNKKG